MLSCAPDRGAGIVMTLGGGLIFQAAGATDMRNSLNGLAGIVCDRLGADPMSRHIFLSCKLRKNTMKVLVPTNPGAC